MKRELGLVLMSSGIVLLIMSLSLFLENSAQGQAAKRNAERLMPPLLQRIEEGTGDTHPIVPPGTPAEMLDPAVLEMREVQIGGNGYIGYLTIPDLGLELPVMSDWSYEKLKTAPCRYAGTVLSEDLVLMAHNYTSHFGKLQNLSIGAKISFTDVDGITTWYEVVAVETLAPTSVGDMTDGTYDLTLFTCTYGGKNRVTVRCDRLAVS